MICRHCSKLSACRPRGLCWRCYYTPGVKDQYPSEATGAAALTDAEILAMPPIPFGDLDEPPPPTRAV